MSFTGGSDPVSNGDCVPEVGVIPGCVNSVNASELDQTKTYTPTVTSIDPVPAQSLFITAEDEVTFSGQGFSSSACNVSCYAFN